MFHFSRTCYVRFELAFGFGTTARHKQRRRRGGRLASIYRHGVCSVCTRGKWEQPVPGNIRKQFYFTDRNKTGNRLCCAVISRTKCIRTKRIYSSERKQQNRHHLGTFAGYRKPHRNIYLLKRPPLIPNCNDIVTLRAVCCGKRTQILKRRNNTHTHTR